MPLLKPIDTHIITCWLMRILKVIMQRTHFKQHNKIKNIKLVDISCLCYCLSDLVMTPCLECVGLTKTENFIINIVPLAAIKQFYEDI